RVKAEAKRIAVELELREERIRLGLEVVPEPSPFQTVGELMEWWLRSRSVNLKAHAKNTSQIRSNILEDPVASVELKQLTTGTVKEYLERMRRMHSAGTCNHLRGFLSRAFRAAAEDDKFHGENPVAKVRKFPVPRHRFRILEPQEVEPTLKAIEPRWRNVLAVALYTGMRKGEILSLTRDCLDFKRRQIYVASSWTADT